MNLIEGNLTRSRKRLQWRKTVSRTKNRIVCSARVGYDAASMNDYDRVAEWNRLKEAYSGMSDDELQSVASEAFDLTDFARQALQAEISRRGATITLQDKPAPVEPDEPMGDFVPTDDDLLVVHRVWMLKKHATSSDCSMTPASLPTLAPTISDHPDAFKAGVDVKIWEEDNQRASLVLSQGLPQDEGGENDEKDYVALCPKCHSDQIVFQSLERRGFTP